MHILLLLLERGHRHRRRRGPREDSLQECGRSAIFRRRCTNKKARLPKAKERVRARALEKKERKKWHNF